jgi:hypothetical protein
MTATLYLNLWNSINERVVGEMAPNEQLRKQYPQSMQRSDNTSAFPSLTRMDLVGHVRMQAIQPLHLAVLISNPWVNLCIGIKPHPGRDMSPYTDLRFDV